MKLTGQAKALFEKWYLLLIRKERKDYDRFSDEQILRKFYRLLPSQRWGVLQDFADSLEVELKVFVDHRHGTYIAVVKHQNVEVDHPTRQEARTAAIEKLNQIINEK